MRYSATSLELSEEELMALEVIYNIYSGYSWPSPELNEMAIRLFFPGNCGLQLNQLVVRKLRQKRLLETGRHFDVVDWGDNVKTQKMDPVKIAFRLTEMGMLQIREAGIKDYTLEDLKDVSVNE